MQALDSEDPQHSAWWDALSVVGAAELAVATAQDEADRARLRGEAPPPLQSTRAAGLHSAIDDDVHAMLGGAWHAQIYGLSEGITRIVLN